MSKQTVYLTLVEMFAIKHALQNTLKDKKAVVGTLQGTTVWEENIEKLEKLQKDIPHEEALVILFENLISEFKEQNNIK